MFRLMAEKPIDITPIHSIIILAIVAAILMAPAFVFGTWQDSTHNFAWVDGFAAELQKGWIYPRWLSQGFDGLGSPSFYFYPPLPFLAMGLSRQWPEPGFRPTPSSRAMRL